jgi:tetratricopeptide (TPR) repeat protein
MPSFGLGGLVGTGLNRLLLRARGYGFTPQAENQIPQRHLMMLDAAGATSQSTAFLLGVGGVGLQTRTLRHALAAGEPRRVARALLGEVGYLSIYGCPAAAQSDRALAAAEKTIAGLDDPAMRAQLEAVRGLVIYNRGDFVEALALFERAIAEFRVVHRGPNRQYDIALVELFRLYTLQWLGRYDELARSRAALLREASERGDQWAGSLVELAAGDLVLLWSEDATAASVAQEAAILSWRSHRFGFPHLLHMMSRVNRALSEGRGADALAQLEADRGHVKRAMVLGSQMLRAGNLYVWGRALLATRDRAHERRVLGIARRLEREDVSYAVANAFILRAAVAFRRGDRAAALDALGSADQILTRTHAEGSLVIARTLRARVLGGDEGEALARANAAECTRVGLRRPEMILPFLGLPEAVK